LPTNLSSFPRPHFKKQAPTPDQSTILAVTIKNGQVLSANKQLLSYQPITLTLAHDNCQTFTAVATNQEKIPLRACYKNNFLLLSPDSPDQKTSTNSLIFYTNALWDSGYTYHNISAPNSTFLNHVDVTLLRR
jgi:hypothetical protein